MLEKSQRGRQQNAAGVGHPAAEILEGLSDGIVAVDDSWRVTYVNPAAETLWPCDAAMLLGRPLFEALAISVGDPLRIACTASKNGSMPVFLSVFSEAGARWLSVRGHPWPGGYAIFFRDVTQERRSFIATIDRQRDYEAQRSINQRIFETSLDLILVVSRHGDFIRVSPSSTIILGYRPEDMIGRSAVDFLFPDDLENTRQEMRKARHGRLMRNFECRYVHKDGHVVPLTWTGVWSEGDQQHFFIGRDMTERIAAEERQRRSQRLEAIGQLTGGIAHDFNNMLTVVIGNLGLMQEKVGADEKLGKYASAALHASRRGAELTRQLLAFARRQPLDPRVVAINERVSGTLDLLQRSLGEQVIITTALAPDLEPALADPAQFESALVNLAINARDAMPAGGRLAIETANVHLDERYTTENPDVAAGNYVMVAVSDTGTGMPPEVLARVFEPFFTTKPLGQGTGLGLSMIYGFARQSQGHVKIYSEVGHGTTVRLYLPRAAAGRAVDVTAAAPTRMAMAKPGERILVVEDNPAVREVVVSQLRQLGYGALEAASGDAAMALLQRGEAIDLLFTDVVMPGGMSGDELVRAARRLRPGLKALMTSGFTTSMMQTGGSGDGFAGLLTKPYRKIELAARLRDALDGK